VKPTRLHGAIHALRADFADQLRPVATHVRLTADDCYLARAESRHLADEVEAFLGGEFSRTTLSGARSAVLALQIARQSNLPNYVHWTERVTVFVREKAPGFLHELPVC
jgi:protein gp37